jgi:hypothetical protein
MGDEVEVPCKFLNGVHFGVWGIGRGIISWTRHHSHASTMALLSGSTWLWIGSLISLEEAFCSKYGNEQNMNIPYKEELPYLTCITFAVHQERLPVPRWPV